MAAKTIKQWTINGKEKGFDELKLGTAPFPKCGDNEVLIKLGAASLNYRDLIIPKVCPSAQERNPVGTQVGLLNR